MLYFLRICFKLSHFSHDTMHFGCAEGTQPTGGAAKQTDSKLHLFFFAFALFSVVLIFTDQAKKSVQSRIPLTKSLLRNSFCDLPCSAYFSAGQITRLYLELTAVNVIRQQTGLFCVRINPVEEAAHLTASSVFNLLHHNTNSYQLKK